MSKTVISIVGPVSITTDQEELNSTSGLNWQNWATSAAKLIIVYCGISIGILFVITYLILSGSILHVDMNRDAKNVSDIKQLKPVLHANHLHTMEFYTFVMTVLVSIRAGFYYMAKALQRAAYEKDLAAIGIWLIISFLIMMTEALLGVALFKCLPGTLSIILLFLFVELIVQTTFIWVVWSFKLDLSSEKKTLPTTVQT